MNPILTLAIAATPAFVAAGVEFVEAFTIVLAIGNTRGWRAPLWGTAAAVAVLAVIVLGFGAPLIYFKDQVEQYFHIAVGTLLLLFGMRWLRKAILRFAEIVALHDEELIYQRQVADLKAHGRGDDRWDGVGFLLSFKSVLLEGLEAAFIVIALGTQGGAGSLNAAIVGASAAFLFTMVAGALLRKPLTVVPENWMKFVVGAMLTSFGIYWGAEGFLVEWWWGEATIPVILAGICATSWVGVRMLGFMLPRGAHVAARNV